jgi:hypothetical protein
MVLYNILQDILAALANYSNNFHCYASNIYYYLLFEFNSTFYLF